MRRISCGGSANGATSQFAGLNATKGYAHHVNKDLKADIKPCMSFIWCKIQMVVATTNKKRNRKFETNSDIARSIGWYTKLESGCINC